MDKLIIYEDDNVIVVHKPSGVATQTANIGQPDIVSKLKSYRKQKGEDAYIGVVHRLDQPVEGLLVFAKTSKAAANLTAQLNNGTLKKSYTALVDGDIPVGVVVELTDYLIKDTRTNLSKVVAKGTKDAKEARLRYECVENHGEYSKVRVEIYSGRHHQIRVQMSNVGYPLLGDMKYGNAHSTKISETLGIRNVSLYADRLFFNSPATGEGKYFELKKD
jgi:23S rRNA pseudouridine1911/1915/1917 synthase